MNKHLNLFYTYQTHHLEDNLTRAFMITLASLRPVHLRLFLRDVIAARSRLADVFRNKVTLLARPEFSFDVQLSESPEDEKLTEQNGIIVGLTASGSQNLQLDQQFIDTSGARPDAMLSDETNELTVLFETKLSDVLYQAQLARHFNKFFDPQSTSLDRVFLEVGWTDIQNFLESVRRQSQSERYDDSREAFIVDQFMEYLDLIGLGEFRGFRREDFSDDRPDRLRRFLSFIHGRLASQFALAPYDGGQRIDFSDLTRWENLWFEWDTPGLRCGLVCGAGAKWWAERLRDYIRDHRDKFNQLIAAARTALDADLEVDLRIHSWFRRARSPRLHSPWLGDVRGHNVYPNQFEKFCETITDPVLNTFTYLDKPTINRVFAAEISASNQPVDDQGLFPERDDPGGFLQYCYFHVDVGVPERLLLQSAPDRIIELFEPVIGALRQIAVALDAI